MSQLSAEKRHRRPDAAGVKAERIIKSMAPIRICDNGGWTDTWFAGHGKVFSLAVNPCAEVQVMVFRDDGSRPKVCIHAENYGERYGLEADQIGCYGRHPLLEAAFDYMHLPHDLALDVSIFSEAPAGCSTGTSAAVSVALIGALDALTPGRMTPHEVAMAAHRIETELLHQQCGIQDQLASAYGGINYIEMFEYPHAFVSPMHIPSSLWWELESRLLLIFLGRSHSSSKVHEAVIKGLESSGPQTPALCGLRCAAEKAKNALYAGDLRTLGAALVENTELQRQLHPSLVGVHHQHVIDIAREFGATGWKVNGAGGDGGSVTILCGPDQSVKRRMVRAIEESGPGYQSIPIYLSRSGLRVWESC